MASRLLEAEVERDEWKARVEALDAFKKYVHERLDAAQVPANPQPPKHALAGCRIGDRLDFIEKQRGELQAQRDEAAAQAERLREALTALLPDPKKVKPNVVERHLSMGRMWLRVAGAYVAIEATQCFDGEYGERFMGGPLRWTGEDFKRIEEKFAAPIRAALTTPAPAWLRERDRALAMRVANRAFALGLNLAEAPKSETIESIVAEVVP